MSSPSRSSARCVPHCFLFLFSRVVLGNGLGNSLGNGLDNVLGNDLGNGHGNGKVSVTV